MGAQWLLNALARDLAAGHDRRMARLASETGAIRCADRKSREREFARTRWQRRQRALPRQMEMKGPGL